MFRNESFDAGIDAMRAVVDFQTTNWAPEVSHIWDANEQLAEMLLLRGLQNDIQLALDGFEAALRVYPIRYNSLAGAARCAEELGDAIKASRYYGDLLNLAKGPFPNVTLSGIYSSICGLYSMDRRPDLVLATKYFDSFSNDESSQGDDSSEVQLSNIEIAVLVSSVIFSFTLGYLMKNFIKKDSTDYSHDNNSKLATPVYDPLLSLSKGFLQLSTRNGMATAEMDASL